VNMNYKISVVTICYNAESEIKRTLDSVYGQTLQAFQYVVVDGKSTDLTLDVIGEYRDDRMLLCSEPDGGIADAFNKASRLADGDLVVFLNAGDCFVDSGVLRRVVDAVSGVPNVLSNVFYGDHVLLHNGKQRVIEASLDGLSNRCSICHQAVFIGKEIYKKMSYDTRFSIAMDHDYWLRVIEEHEFHYLGFPVCLYEWGGVSSDPRRVIPNAIETLTVLLINGKKEKSLKTMCIFISSVIIKLTKEKLRLYLGERVFVFFKSLFGLPSR